MKYHKECRENGQAMNGVMTTLTSVVLTVHLIMNISNANNNNNNNNNNDNNDNNNNNVFVGQYFFYFIFFYTACIMYIKAIFFNGNFAHPVKIDLNKKLDPKQKAI